MRMVGGCSLMGRCFPVVTCFLQQRIELEFKLIFDAVAVEELTHMLIEPCGLFLCEWAWPLENQVTLSPLQLQGTTQLPYLKSGLVLQISLRALLRSDTPTSSVSMLISKHQDERASREMLEDVVQDESECAIERWSRLRCTSFWDGHVVVVCACLATIQSRGLLFHCWFLSIVRFE